ncbi:MAG: DoxX family protein [Arenimonas sp.]|jgi:putative oxidoreductase
MFELRNKERWSRWAPLALRLVIGYGFIVHGCAKLSRGPGKFAGVLDWMGVPLPEVMAWVVTLVEIFGGLAILVGAFVTLVSIPLVVIHIVAMIGVHFRYGFSSVNTVGLTAAGPQFGPPGFEVNLLYIAGLLAIVLGGGAGIWSVDRLLASRRTGRA